MAMTSASSFLGFLSVSFSESRNSTWYPCRLINPGAPWRRRRLPFQVISPTWQAAQLKPTISTPSELASRDRATVKPTGMP